MIAELWLLCMIVCMLIGGWVFSIAYALHTCSRMKITSYLQDLEDDQLEKRVRSIIDDLSGHASIMTAIGSIFQIGIVIFAILWINTLREAPTPDLVTFISGSAVGLIAIWISTTIIPMGIADHVGERAILVFSRLIRLMHAIFVPLVPIWRFTNEVIRRLSGQDHGSKDSPIIVTDLRSIVEDDEVHDKLDETERDMLEAVVEFRSTSVEQIMTPRTEINAIEYTDDRSEIESFLREHGHSRLPVFSENLDHIEGMLYAKDLLKWIISHGANGEPFVLKKLLREPSFVPETKTVRELLSQLLADQVHIAIILDEYGGTSGLVTMEDIVEEIFGEIQDEYEEPEDETSIVIDHANAFADIDARTEIDDANDELETLDIELPESDDYDTVGGYINTVLGRIPEQGETCIHEQFRFEILEAEPTKVVRLRVARVIEEDIVTDVS